MFYQSGASGGDDGDERKPTPPHQLDLVKSQMRKVIKNSKSGKEIIDALRLRMASTVLLTATTKTTLDDDDDNYDEDADNFDEGLKAHLPQPTPDGQVASAVAHDGEAEVVLWTGCSPSKAEGIASNGSAGGAAPDPDTARIPESARKNQIGHGRQAGVQEFTASANVNSFSTNAFLVVVRIKAKYLVRGASASEAGWIAAESAPVEVLAVVDRTQGKAFKGTGNAS